MINEHKILQDKADELNKNAWEKRVSDSNLAFKLSKEAVEISTAISYLKGKAEGLRTHGFCLIRFTRHTEALPLLKEAEKLFIQLKDSYGESSVLEYFGIISRSQGDYMASLDYLFKSLNLQEKDENHVGKMLTFYHIGVTYRYLGNLDKALEYLLESLAIATSIDDWVGESYSLTNIGIIYYELNDNKNALDYFERSLAIRIKTGDKWGESGCLDNIGNIHFRLGHYNEAFEYYNQSLDISNTVGDRKGQSNVLLHLSNIHVKNNKPEEALSKAKLSLQIREEIGDKKGQTEVYLHMAKIEGDVNSGESELAFLNKALLIGNEIKALDLLCSIHNSMYNSYKKLHDFESALIHLEEFHALEVVIHSNSVKEKIISLETTHHFEQTRKETELLQKKNNELAGFYEEIKKQKKQVEKQKKIAEDSLVELQTTQTQLIQSEKMASLGELTAGIAHEIQNPLNFVNNFSEVSNELLDEMKAELDKGDIEEAKAIANNVQQNLEKITHHGKRADAIVKGMLQHSRSSSGVKEPTDINALCDEYLRLSYHGLRAKDKSFNAMMKTDFDNSIGNINIVPQDMGRVILNLLTNAFYEVDEKKKSGIEGYEPSVSISTKKMGNNVFITVTDNGNGIPQKVLNKIFQPFFTTKPTGQGTGLGLSLSYDIVTKGHGGKLKIETIEGEGSVFIIVLNV